MVEIVKLVVFVPVSHGDAVRKVMGDAGAGIIGNYTFCTFTTVGVGRFKAGEGANPSVGKVGALEEVVEERIETVCRKDIVKEVIAAIKKVHPYEEAPIDVYPLENI